MLPVTERELFKEIYRPIQSGSCFVIHGPYQSGKTSFLWGLRDKLKENGKAVVELVDMSDITPPLRFIDNETIVREAFARSLSFRILGRRLSWDLLTSALLKLPDEPHYYILVDEFQSVFASPNVLKVAKDFFKTLPKPSVSYIAVGTFRLTDLTQDDGNTIDSPFNKAGFYRLPPFDFKEMGELFKLYKRFCNPCGLTPEIQGRIVHESKGHPASFNVLLKLALQYEPNEYNWTQLLQDNIGKFLNGTQNKTKEFLKSMNSDDRAQVRGFTGNQMNEWPLIDDELNRSLFNIGVLTPNEERMTVRFTSGIILRVCIETLWPRPLNRLSENECLDPIGLLALGLQSISPSNVTDPLVKNMFGPQESAFQIALYAAFHELLPDSMKCLFEARAENRDQIDLIIRGKDSNYFGYELKVNAVSQSDFKSHLKQATKYAEHYKIPIYLVNFYLEGHSTPVTVTPNKENVFVVNILHNKDCTRFEITGPDGEETTVHTHDHS
jgi:hypothetical protein